VKKYLVRLIILLVVVAAVFSVLRFTPAGEFLKPANLEANKDALFESVSEHYLLAIVLYILLYIAVVAFSIPGATVLTLLGGFFFGGVSGLAGVGLGTVYVNIGASAGAFLVFLAARYFLGDMVHEKYGDRLEKFNKELEENGKNYLLTMRFIPIFPFWMINLLAGVAKVKPITFLWTTSLGIIPGSAVYSYVGYAFGSVGGEAQTVIRNVVVALVALAVVSLVPVVLKKVRARRAGAEQDETNVPR
jgi:uncharacterized membrane protein YdjX (TVP38/TMEM64 family)